MSCRCASITILLVIWAGSAAAQPPSSDAQALPPFVAKPIALYQVGLGSFSRKISSSNAEAQAFFDQGKSTVDVDEDLRASWSRSDTWIRASRF